jgi:hypothetical protein
MRRRPIIRKAVKSAIIVKAAEHLATRTEKHLRKKLAK